MGPSRPGCPHPADRRAMVPPLVAGLLVLTCLSAGCALPRSPSQASVPAAWRRTNPWGPEANAARAAGCLQPRFYTSQMAAWAAFGRANLQTGDILFRYGRSTTPMGWLSSRVVSGISGSRFTHDAFVCREGDDVFIYDAMPEPEGVRKIPFEFWMLDTDPGSLVIKRLRPPFRSCIPQAVAYIEDAYRRQPPFDTFLHLDDEKLYCTELLEKAYRCAGLALSDLVPTRCLPHYPRYGILRPVVERLTSFRVDEPVFALGNACFGLFASPYLETVLDEQAPDDRHPSLPPRCPPVPFPGGACPTGCALPGETLPHTE